MLWEQLLQAPDGVLLGWAWCGVLTAGAAASTEATVLLLPLSSCGSTQVDEAVPLVSKRDDSGKDDRLLRYTIYAERDGVRRKEVSVREK